MIILKYFQRRNSIKDEITATVDEHIRALEEKKRRLVENLDEIFQSKEKVVKIFISLEKSLKDVPQFRSSTSSLISILTFYYHF